jgi:hypothetical protein
MVARSVSNPPAALHCEPAGCFPAIELSKTSWIVAVHTPIADKISRYKLKGCDWKGLLEWIKRIRTHVTKELGRSVAVVSCYEASYDWFWLHRLPQAHVVDNYVFDPASVAGRAHSKGFEGTEVIAIIALKAVPVPCAAVQLPMSSPSGNVAALNGKLPRTCFAEVDVIENQVLQDGR